MKEPRSGDLKVWYIPQLPGQAFEVYVPDLKTAVLMLDALCRFSCYEYETKVKPDYADLGGVVRFEGGDQDGEWVDVEDDELDAHSDGLMDAFPETWRVVS